MFVAGIDVGGAFTDVTAVDTSTGRVLVTKVPSQPLDEAAAVLAGVAALRPVARSARGLAHATPGGAHALLIGRGRPGGLATAAGVPDLSRIGRARPTIPAA